MKKAVETVTFEWPEDKGKYKMMGYVKFKGKTIEEIYKLDESWLRAIVSLDKPATNNQGWDLFAAKMFLERIDAEKKDDEQEHSF